MMAAEKGHAEAVALLLARGADIAQADEEGSTALLYARREPAARRFTSHACCPARVRRRMNRGGPRPPERVN